MAKRSSTTTPASVPVAHPQTAEKTVAAPTEAAKTVGSKTDAVKSVTAANPVKVDAVKTDVAKTGAAKTDSLKTSAVKTDAVKADAVKTDAAKAVTPATVQSAILFPVLPTSDAATIRSRELVFTLDGWKSLQVLRSSEAPRAFSENQVLLDGVPPGTPVEFALRLELAGHSIWLNNGGRNYRQLSA